jgi:hypothetical protein
LILDDLTAPEARLTLLPIRAEKIKVNWPDPAGDIRVDQRSSTEAIQFLDLRLDPQRGVLYRLREGGVAAPIGVAPEPSAYSGYWLNDRGRLFQKARL